MPLENCDIDQTTNRTIKEFTEILDRLRALEIILTCPLWPAREELPDAALLLYDEMLTTAKQYAIHVAADECANAIAIAALWTIPLNSLMDGVRIVTCKPAQMLLLVYRHYLDAMGVDWCKVKGTAA